MIDKNIATNLFKELGFFNNSPDNLTLFNKLWKFLNILDHDQV